MKQRTEQESNIQLKHIRKRLQGDQSLYIESIGRQDERGLIGAFDGDDKTTVLRLVMGATARMPYRALSYIDTLLRIARVIPVDQVQIVHAVNLGNKINDIDLATSIAQFDKISVHSMANRQLVDLDVVHATDTPLDTDQFVPLAEEALGRDGELAEKLQSKGTKHGGDSVRYLAAHYAFQDTDLLELSSPNQIRPDRIISVGGSQERTFYRGRMGMQALRGPDVETAQIFTRHLIPPYYTARGGEPEIDDGVGDLSDIDPAARRDIEHFLHNNEGVTS